MSEEFDIHLLDPKAVRLQRGAGGILAGTIEGQEYVQIILTRTFPLSKPYEYISFSLPTGEEIGIVKKLSQLDPESFAEAKAELKLRYLIPVVQRIHKITQEPGLWIWELLTDRGPLKLVMQNLHEHVQSISRERLLITDMDGRRCEIANILQLDPHSRHQLNKTI